jgi:hypothetical protein
LMDDLINILNRYDAIDRIWYIRYLL